MSFQVFNKLRAEQEILEAASWYEEQQLGLGIRFLDELENVFIEIKANPFLFQKKYGETTQVGLSVFPFVLLYQVEEEIVVVFAVFHTSRNPAKRP